MRRSYTLLIMLLLVGYSARSAGLPTLSARGTAAIDHMFQAAIDAGEIPGVVAAVTNTDRIVYLEAFGKQDVGKGVPMSKDTLFRIASMTKPITSVGVMMLREQGRLRLDDAAGDYVPSLKGRDVIAAFNEKDATYTTRPAKQDVTEATERATEAAVPKLVPASVMKMPPWVGPLAGVTLAMTGGL